MRTRAELVASGDEQWAELENGLLCARVEKNINPHVVIRMQVESYAMAVRIWNLLDDDEHKMVTISWLSHLSEHPGWVMLSVVPPKADDGDKDLGDTFCAQCGTSMLRDKRGGLVVAHECAR